MKKKRKIFFITILLLMLFLLFVKTNQISGFILFDKEYVPIPGSNMLTVYGERPIPNRLIYMALLLCEWVNIGSIRQTLLVQHTS